MTPSAEETKERHPWTMVQKFSTNLKHKHLESLLICWNDSCKTIVTCTTTILALVHTKTRKLSGMMKLKPIKQQWHAPHAAKACFPFSVDIFIWTNQERLLKWLKSNYNKTKSTPRGIIGTSWCWIRDRAIRSCFMKNSSHIWLSIQAWQQGSITTFLSETAFFIMYAASSKSLTRP